MKTNVIALVLVTTFAACQTTSTRMPLCLGMPQAETVEVGGISTILPIDRPFDPDMVLCDAHILVRTCQGDVIVCEAIIDQSLYHDNSELRLKSIRDKLELCFWAVRNNGGRATGNPLSPLFSNEPGFEGLVMQCGKSEKKPASAKPLGRLKSISRRFAY